MPLGKRGTRTFCRTEHTMLGLLPFIFRDMPAPAPPRLYGNFRT